MCRKGETIGTSYFLGVMKKYAAIFLCQAFGVSGIFLRGEVTFEKDILPIFEARCIECHKKPYEEDGKLKKPKAGLRLDGAWHIMKGSEDGPIIVPGRKDASTLIYHISLPSDDDDIMPPKGKPLTREEIGKIGLWVEEEARFDGWEGATDGIVKEEAKVFAVPSHVKAFKKLEEGLKPLSDEVLEQVATKSGATVRRLHPNSPLVDVGFFTTPNELGNEAVLSLAPLKQHVTKLVLARMKISDESLDVVSQFSQLSYLSLKETKVTDAGVKKLAKLKNLVSLNLYGTDVSDEGIAALTQCKTLQKLYIAGTAVTDTAVQKLEKAMPNTQIIRGI